jgi:hypothetical protein
MAIEPAQQSAEQAVSALLYTPAPLKGMSGSRFRKVNADSDRKALFPMLSGKARKTDRGSCTRSARRPYAGFVYFFGGGTAPFALIWNEVAMRPGGPGDE